MIYLWSVSLSKQILRIAMEIFERDAESETGKWRLLLVNVSVCLLTSRPIPERHFYFRAVGRGFWNVWRNQMAQRYFKIKAIFGLIYRFYILIPYVESTNENSRLIWKVYNDKVIGFILWNIRHSFIWRRRTRKLVRPSPYELVPNISQYKFNNL